MSTDSLELEIRKATARIGKTWPLYSFVTSNPLSGYEDAPFAEAIVRAGKLRGGQILPGAAQYRKAYRSGEIADEIVRKILKENGFSEPPEHYLDLMETVPAASLGGAATELNRITAKWVMAFLDEGLAEWPMPHKSAGFYGAWRKLAIYDRELPREQRRAFPQTPREAIREALNSYPLDQHGEIMEQHLAALPGWAGFIRYRQESASSWQDQFPIDLEEYLAVRLTLADRMGVPLFQATEDNTEDTIGVRLRHLWLLAWEQSWQKTLKNSLEPYAKARVLNDSRVPPPDAQMVFCIDTRSEPMRRQIEKQGNYETFGYAGFFGIAMDYENPGDGLVRKSCPPILPSAYRVRESHMPGEEKNFGNYLHGRKLGRFRDYFLRRIKNMLPSAFGYVEASGALYGLSLLARTWMPDRVYRLLRKIFPGHERFCEPKLTGAVPGDFSKYHKTDGEEPHTGIPLEQQVAIVKGAFDLMGWREFAPLILLVGHGSHSANNPFASSLDCGACAASPGRHNARMLANLANRPEVRRSLMYEHGVFIPETTHFMAAEHNTTTEEIVLFDQDLPSTHNNLCYRVRQALIRARKCSLESRLGTGSKRIAAAERCAGDWAETRPEWGLAKNAGFVIGPRDLTKDLNLGGRCFLHSYQWELDTEGTALEAIMQGPMVVTQWINNHYFFATVDPERFGGGDKITHNITGRHGVLSGNGGDLKAGLPFQSLYESDTDAYHQPLRLTVCIQAPRDRVTAILSRNENLKALLDNTWIYLIVLDPETGLSSTYDRDLVWKRSDSDPLGEISSPGPLKTELEVAGAY